MLLFCPYAYGQFVYTENYTTDDGLLSNEITALYQDSRGLLWIGSSTGVLAKSMEQFLGIIEVNENKFINIKSIIEDDNSHIWIGSSSHGIMRFDGIEGSLIFNSSNGLLSEHISKLFYFKGKIFASNDRGVSIIDVATSKIICNLEIENFNPGLQNTSFFIYKDQVYVSTYNNGVFLIDISKQKLTPISPYKDIFSLMHFGDDLYYSNIKGFFRYNISNQQSESFKKIPFSYDYDFKNSNTVYFVSPGNEYGYGGLFQIHNNQISPLSSILEIPHDDLISIALDNNNNKMYLGTKSNGLLEVYFDNPLKRIESDISVESLSSTEDLLYVFSNQGLNLYDSSSNLIKKIRLESFVNFKKNNLKSSFRDPEKVEDSDNSSIKFCFYRSIIHNKYLWVSSSVGLFKISLEGKIIDHFAIFSPLFDFYKDQLVEILPQGGIRVYSDLKTLKNTYFSENFSNTPKNFVDVLSIDDKLFIASPTKGLFVFDRNKIISLYKTNQFSENRLKKIVTTNDKKILVVTEYDDIYQIDPSTYHHFLKYSHQQIKGKGIQTIIQTNEKVFVGTNKGIEIFENDLHYLMDKEQGLDSYNYSAISAAQGNVFLGTREGLYKMTEYFENIVNDYTPNIRIFEIIINGQSIDKTNKYSWFNIHERKLILNHNQNNIRIYFTDWNPKFPQKVNFRYRLKRDEKWSNVLTKIEIDLNYLEPGDYEVEMEIENLSTGKKYYQTILFVHIKPSFFQTWTFYLLLSSLLILSSFFIYRYRLFVIRKRVQEKNRILLRQKEDEKVRAEIEKQKVILESKLAKTRMQALRSQMNPHFIFNALNTLQFFILSQDRNKGLNYLAQFSKLVRETLENSINDYITLADELEYLKVYTSIENMRFEDRDIRFVFQINDEIDSNEVFVPPMISQPFVENSILHAFDESIENPSLTFIYSKDKDYLICEIIDNGIGFVDQESEVTKHVSRGMSLVKERIHLLLPDLENPIEIFSLEGGTHVRIVLPYILKQNLEK